jgi:DNA-binding response OmpR family regulator
MCAFSLARRVLRDETASDPRCGWVNWLTRVIGKSGAKERTPVAENGQSLLVVEDDPELNELVGAYARICGFEYRAALNGNSALQEAARRPPALVILDLMLPDLDGFEVCRRFKSNPQLRSVPVIILSALGGEEERERGRSCGAAEYVTKPFDPDRLMQTIARHAGGGRPESAR